MNNKYMQEMEMTLSWLDRLSEEQLVIMIEAIESASELSKEEKDSFGWNGFSWDGNKVCKLERIVQGLKEGLDIIEYPYAKFNPAEHEFDTEIAIKWMGRFDRKQLVWILNGYNWGVDISLYADEKFDRDQMIEILSGLLLGLNVSVYLDEKISGEEMRYIRIGMIRGLTNIELMEIAIENSRLGRFGRNKQ